MSKITPKTLRWALILCVCAAFVPIWVKAKPLFQSDQNTRDPQLVRELSNQALDPSSRWMPVEENRQQPEAALGSIADFPSWSYITFQSYRSLQKGEIYTLQADRTEQRLYSGAGNSGYPVVQRNGNQIAFQSNWYGSLDIFAVLPNGAGLRSLTQDPTNEYRPAWSPDGQWLLFQSDRSGSSDIYRMDSNGGQVVLLISSPNYEGEASWSPDGKKIVYVSNQRGYYELWLANADGSNQHAITSNTNVITPDWSPRGDQIAFGNDSDGDTFYELWTVDAEGGKPTKVETNSYGGNMDVWAPAWSPDGKSLAFITTSWIEYEGEWYWTSSQLYWKDFWFGGIQLLTSDAYIWRADWGTSDALPPGECTVLQVIDQARSRETALSFSAQDQGASGVVAYDGQVREPGGEWETFVEWIKSGGAVYKGSGLGQVEFRCRAHDLGGNIGPWSSTLLSSSDKDAISPVSSVNSGSVKIRGTQATITWGGSDQGDGIANYDLYTRKDNGVWQAWQTGTTATQAVFTGERDHTYAFRSQARDRAGHLEPWRPNSQAAVTFYTTIMTLTISDGRDIPVWSPTITISPQPLVTETTTSPSVYRFYLADSPTHSISVSMPGYPMLPPATLATTQDTSFTWVFPLKDEKVANGGFENADWQSWLPTPNGITLTVPGHSGYGALELSNRAAISQSVLLDTIVLSPTLSFLYRMPATLENGRFDVTVASTNTTTTTLSTSSASGDWVHAWFDLSDFLGEQITLTFVLTGTGSIQLDEVSLGSWEEPQWPEGPKRVYLPLILKNTMPGAERPTADWPFYGYDAARTSYNRGEPGASHYQFAWQTHFTKSSGSCYSGMETSVSDGLLFMHHPCAQEIVALDAQTGQQRWRHPTSIYPYPVNIANGMAYFHDYQSTSSAPSFYALDIDNGALIWSVPNRGAPIPAIVDHWIIDQNGRASNASTGVLEWGNIDYPDRQLGYVSAYDGRWLYTWVGGSFYAIDPQTGSIGWELSIVPFDSGTLNRVVVAQDVGIVATDYKLYGISLKTRQTQWTVDLMDVGPLIQPTFAVADDVVYVIDGTLMAYSLLDGHHLWTFTPDDYTHYGVNLYDVVVTQNYLYVSSEPETGIGPGNTYILDRKTHQKVDQIPFGGDIAVANGFLYITTFAPYDYDAEKFQTYAYRAQEP